MKFNINRYVKVQLTDLGRKIHREMINKTFEFTPQYRTDEFYNKHYKPKEDKNSWSTWQLHELMSIFGNHLILGGHLPFKTDIEIIEEKED